MPWTLLLRSAISWLSAGFITYEVAGVVEDIADKYPDVTYDASGQPLPGAGPHGTTRATVVATVLVASVIAYAINRLIKRLG